MINTQDKINKILGKKGKRRLKSFKLVETIDDGNQDIAEVFKCQDCGKTIMLQGVGGEPACCPCEFKNEGR